MSYKHKRKKPKPDEVEVEIDPPIIIEPPRAEVKTLYGFVIGRSGLGWRTLLIKVAGDIYEIVQVTSPDTKANALFKGERWIESQTG